LIDHNQINKTKLKSLNGEMEIFYDIDFPGEFSSIRQMKKQNDIQTDVGMN
jgi:hypothetical protein